MFFFEKKNQKTFDYGGKPTSHAGKIGANRNR